MLISLAIKGHALVIRIRDPETLCPHNNRFHAPTFNNLSIEEHLRTPRLHNHRRMVSFKTMNVCECGHPKEWHNIPPEPDAPPGSFCWDCGPCWEYRERKEH